MGNDPAFLFYPGDYLRDTQCLSEPSQVAYDRIMCEHMRNIPISQARLNFFIKRLNHDQKDEINSVLSLMDGGFCIDWVYASILKRRAYSQSRSLNRKKSYDNHVKSYEHHMENENANCDLHASTPDLSTTPLKASVFKRGLILNFEDIWSKYPKRVGKKAATRHYMASVKNERDLDDVQVALSNYMASDEVHKGFIQNGSTWFNNWRDWLDVTVATGKSKDLLELEAMNNA